MASKITYPVVELRESGSVSESATNVPTTYCAVPLAAAPVAAAPDRFTGLELFCPPVNAVAKLVFQKASKICTTYYVRR